MSSCDSIAEVTAAPGFVADFDNLKITTIRTLIFLVFEPLSVIVQTKLVLPLKKFGYDNDTA